MEKFKTCETAEDLFQLLNEIPPAQRERLPIILVGDDCYGDVSVAAFECTETEGCIVRGFRLGDG